VVRACTDDGTTLEELTEARLKEIAPEVSPDALAVLQPATSVKRRESLGGPGPNAMAAQLKHGRDMFEKIGFPKIA